MKDKSVSPSGYLYLQSGTIATLHGGHAKQCSDESDVLFTWSQIGVKIIPTHPNSFQISIGQFGRNGVFTRCNFTQVGV